MVHTFLGLAVFVSGWAVGTEVLTASDNIETGIILGTAVTLAATIGDGCDSKVEVVTVSEFGDGFCDSCMNWGVWMIGKVPGDIASELLEWMFASIIGCIASGDSFITI